MPRAVIGVASFLLALGFQVSGWVSPRTAVVMWLAAVVLFVFSFATYEPIAKRLHKLGRRPPVSFIIASSIVGALLFGGAAWLFLKFGSDIEEPSIALVRQFCYFSLYLIDNKPVPVGDKFQLAMNGVGVVEKVNYWISPASAKTPTGKPNDPYYSLDHRKPLLEIVHNGAFAWDRALGPGKYWIEFDAKNGHWSELLQIYVSSGKVKQEIKVMDAKGGIIYDSESPK